MFFQLYHHDDLSLDVVSEISFAFQVYLYDDPSYLDYASSVSCILSIDLFLIIKIHYMDIGIS